MNSLDEVIDIMFDSDEIKKIENNHWKPQPGIYRFRINDIQVKKSSGGKPYLDLTANVTDPTTNNEFNSFGYVWLTESKGARIRYGLFLKSLGLDPGSKHKPKDFLDKQGVAVIYRGDSKYLRMQDFCTEDSVVLGPDPSVEKAAPAKYEGQKSAFNSDDNVPF